MTYFFLTKFSCTVMALAGSFLSEDQFTCSICLEVFDNPVSIQCGHTFCQACISSYWDGGRGGNHVYQCPLCKESFRKRPELHINHTLKEITEQFKQMASVEIPIGGGEGAVEDPLSRPQHHYPLNMSLPQRSREMPESVIAEMMMRFQRLPTPGQSPTTHHSGVQHTYGSSPVNTHLSFKTLSSENQLNDPLPPYPPPSRYQTTYHGKLLWTFQIFFNYDHGL